MAPQIVAEKLAKLLQKLSSPKPITVDDIKEIIWNAQKSSGSSELFFLLTEREKGAEWVDYKTFCGILRDMLHLKPLLQESYSSTKIGLSLYEESS